MNTQSYVSGNLALSVYPEHENSLVVINGGRDCAAVDTSMVKRAPRTIHSRRLSAIRVAVFVIVSGVHGYLSDFSCSFSSHLRLDRDHELTVCTGKAGGDALGAC